jgi:hypothetical protein
MKRIIINKFKVKGTRGSRYTLKCNQCHSIFTLRESSFSKGKGLFCSKHCKDINPEMREKASQTIKDGYKAGRIHARGMLGKTAWNKGKCNYWQLKEKNPNWNGGSSYETYGYKWNRSLKRKIRERDGQKCKECKEKRKALVVHHIDYNKQNNKTSNLITLCRSCHSKTNFGRKEWQKHFKAMLGG